MLDLLSRMEVRISDECTIHPIICRAMVHICLLLPFEVVKIWDYLKD